ncbi:hypothetical protein BJX61DRAFT_539371 [Aspergillus egyptiacus]|nr:hypothetical protein BJX61DRAFT_539371 [Aspergillus egyptiacus]
MQANGEFDIPPADNSVENGLPDATSARVENGGNGPPPIAIIGMAARLPGGVNSIPAMYEFLRDKKDGLRDVPLSRFNIDGFYNEGDVAYSMKHRKAYFLDDDIAMTDASFFGWSEMEASGADPRARLLLEVVYECLENAGQTAYRGENIGCYIGAWGVDWAELTLKDGQQRNPMIGAAAGSFFLSSYVAWNLDLHGSTLTVETACSSSMVALHEACQALYAGDCAAAIVGGANLILTPTLHMSLSTTGVLSPSGMCRTFDASADGFGRGEAVNAILLKPLDQAVRDGDVVRAVIRATSMNNDGRTLVVSTPSAEAQEELILRAYEKAQINDVNQTAYFECHGTGTMVGDTTETAAVTRVFPKGIHMGSVKPNFGHSEGTSGITSLIKAVISLEKKILLPHIHLDEPNPKIPFESARLIVPPDEIPWPADRKERISVNNFGVGGTNVHVIVDSASSLGLKNHTKSKSPRPYPRLLVVSANSDKSLRRRIDDIEAYLEKNPESLSDLAFTLGERREHLSHRAFMLAAEQPSRGSFNAGSTSCENPLEVTFVFTGQGAQWPAMGETLIETFEQFRNTIRLLDEALQRLSSPPAWSIEDLLSREDQAGRYNQAEFAQPLCCAVQIGLVDLFSHWGVKPASVIGHSSGEIAAAYSAGGLTAVAAIMVAYHRGKSLQEVKQRGGMAAVGLSREAVTPYLTDWVVIACENSPQSVTLSGDHERLNEIVEKIKAEDSDILCRLLRVDKAYHSSHMHAIAADYETSLQGLSARDSSWMVPLFSTVTGAEITDPAELDRTYWRRNLESPVLFSTAAKAILDSGEEEKPRLFVEIGPHSTLSGPLRQIFSEHPRGASAAYIPSLVRGEDPKMSVLYTMGNLYNSGVAVNLRKINGDGNLLVDLPPYPWQHDTRYWSQTPTVEAWRLRPYPHHELLGSRVMGSTDLEPSWRNNLSLDDAPWLFGHRIMGKTLFPGAGYIAMAGEAIQQVTSSQGVAYQINHLLLKHALFIESTECVELITNLRRARVSDLQDSDWYDFTITAVQSGDTTQLCAGQVRTAPGYVSPTTLAHDGTNLKREVASATWYKALREVGLDYSREFRGLDTIRADPVRHEASAIVKTTKVSPSRYVMHPTTIDRCLQLLSVAIFRGLTRNINIRSLPVLFENIFISQEAEELHVQALSDPGNGNFILGSLSAASNGKILCAINDARLHVLGDDGWLRHERELAARTVWRPHIDFMPVSSLEIPRPPPSLHTELRNRIVDLYILQTASRVQHIDPVEPHLQLYKRWLKVGEDRIMSEPPWRVSDFGYKNDCPFDSSNSLEVIQWLQGEAAEEYPETAPLLTCMNRVLDNIVSVFEGTCKPLSLLMEDDGLKDVYDLLLSFDSCEKFFVTLGHSNPELNILEIGAGTGSATARFLDYLHSSDGTRLYSRYTFTDISAGFLAAAKERFAQYDGVEYAVLDITQDPAKQGFTLESYDLIIASNAVHATPILRESLVNTKSLLAPGGRLFLQELADEDCRGAEYIFGLLPGWWVGENDRRAEKPYVPVSRWREELKAAGFARIDMEIYEQSSVVVNLISSLPYSADTELTVNLLVPQSDCHWIENVRKQFAAEGYTVNICTLDQPPSCDGDVISLLDSDSPFLFGLTMESLQQLRDFILKSTVKRLLWVTKTSQISCDDPRYGLVHGFLRTVHGEYHADGRRFSILDIDEFDEQAVPRIVQVFQAFCRMKQSDEPGREEYAWYDGVVHVSRFESSDLDNELQHPADDRLPRRLGIETPGLLDSMFWREDNPPAPGVGEVKVKVAYVGLNFKDIITALGLISSPDQIGLEGSGVVEAVGSGISHVQVGQKVIFLGPGCFATHITLSAVRVFPLPGAWSLEEGATSPIVSITACQCLLRLGGLRRGQSVLIHAACGGVGLAAIRICKVKGAKIYATVGNEEKVKYLMENFDIPREHIYNSRDSSFYDDLMRETRGRGVDFVLSSVSGELLRTSWKCVAPGGTMFDISRRDVLADAMLPMKHFKDRRSFISVDLSEYTDEAANHSADFSEPLDQGLVGPISPVTCFEASEVAAAFRHMQSGQHIGKILVRMPDNASDLPAKETRAQVTFSPEHAYLLSGGLGGLGCAISNWMVERGARCLVYLSPSAGVAESHHAFAEELKCQGCEAIFVQGSAAEPSDTQKAISMSPKPIRGAIQLALALKDTSFELMTFDDWTIPLTAKVHGTWNLHEALKDTPLDFFLMFGSIAGVAGTAGQCNYSAANTFIHALARYRHSLGQPASVLDLGPVADIGYVSRSPELMKTFNARLEWKFIKEQELLDAVETLIHHSSHRPPPPSGLDPLRFNVNHIILGLAPTAPWLCQRGDRRMSILYNRGQQQQDTPATADDLVDFVAQVEADPEILNRPSTEEYLILKAGFLIKPPSTKTPAGKVDLKAMANIPIDSLIAIEARAWARKRLGVQISLSEITAAGNVKGLVGLAIDELKKRYLRG